MRANSYGSIGNQLNSSRPRNLILLNALLTMALALNTNGCSKPATVTKAPQPLAVRYCDNVCGSPLRACARLKNPWTIPFRWKPCARATAVFLPSRVSISKCAPARFSACSAPTARGKRPLSKSWRGYARVAAAASASWAAIRRCRPASSKIASASACKTPIYRRSSWSARRWRSLHRFYTRTVDGAQLLKRLQLWEKRNALYAKLSGGQKQRLALALALLNDPQVLFLDEPSAGLDPQARLEIHELVLDLRREQRTILMTTHYIEEAEKLCDRVAIVDEGRIVAMGTPREIQERALAHSTIEIELGTPLGDVAMPHWPEADKVTVDAHRMRIEVTTGRPARIVIEMVKWLDEKDVELADIRIKRPSLEDAFIELTGKSLRE